MISRTLPILFLLTLVFLQSCEIDPTGPESDEPLMMATWKDSSLVNMTGTWLLTMESPTDVRLALSRGIARFSSNGRLKYRGTVSEEAFRQIAVKFYGIETRRPMYGVKLEGYQEKAVNIVAYQDSLLVTYCEAEASLGSIYGKYTRVR